MDRLYRRLLLLHPRSFREVLGLLAAAIRQRLTGARRRGGARKHEQQRPSHKQRGSEIMSGLTQDLRYAVRRLLHAPGFSTSRSACKERVETTGPRQTQRPFTRRFWIASEVCRA